MNIFYQTLQRIQYDYRMTDLDEDFQASVEAVNQGKENYSEDEQAIINAWLEKLSEPTEAEEKKISRNKYAKVLAVIVSEKNKLFPPFTEMPPDELMPIQTRKFDFSLKKAVPCKLRSPQPPVSRQTQRMKCKSVSPPQVSKTNTFEDPEEMARAIARSKGQSFADFVVSISRHTADYGQELRSAMKVETNSFKEYVDRVLSQRIKDLTEVLDEEQSRELQKIKKDINKWQDELIHVKRLIEEMIPEFDLDAYKNDKNYLRKFFYYKPQIPEDDSFKRWKEESIHRLKWISYKTCRITSCNEKMRQDMANLRGEISNIEAQESMKQQCLLNQINSEISEYQNLQLERDKLHKENNDILNQLQQLGN